MKLIQSVHISNVNEDASSIHYHVVRSKKQIRKLETEALANHSNNALAFIVISFEKNNTQTHKVGNGWGYYDAGIATDNLVLKASEMNLESCVMGIKDAKEIRGILDIPENEMITAVIGLGHFKNDVSYAKFEQAIKFY